MNIYYLKTLAGIFFVFIISTQILGNEVRDMSSEDLSDIKITIIYDNNSYKAGFRSDWGFSCFITGLEKTILFDTGGDGDLLLENMQTLNIHPSAVDVIFLSHNHWDHTGGLMNILNMNPDVTVFIPASFPENFAQDVIEYGTRIIRIEKPEQLFGKVYSTGELGSSIKEQSLIIETDKGSILVTGCAHPGIVHIAKITKNILPRDILFILGGFHLAKESQGTINGIVSQFQNLKVQYVGPCHCSGEQARSIFKRNYHKNYVEIGAGKVFSIDDLR